VKLQPMRTALIALSYIFTDSGLTPQ